MGYIPPSQLEQKGILRQDKGANKKGPINEVEVTSHAPDPIHQFEISRLIKISIGNMDFHLQMYHFL